MIDLLFMVNAAQLAARTGNGALSVGSPIGPTPLDAGGGGAGVIYLVSQHSHIDNSQDEPVIDINTSAFFEPLRFGMLSMASNTDYSAYLYKGHVRLGSGKYAFPLPTHNAFSTTYLPAASDPLASLEPYMDYHHSMFCTTVPGEEKLDFNIEFALVDNGHDNTVGYFSWRFTMNIKHPDKAATQ